MNKLSLVLGSTLLLVAASAAPVSLVQNEYDFAAAVAKQGVRDGFLQYLDPRRDLPAHGRQAQHTGRRLHARVAAQR
ncbi:MAG TPA: hypothetical protein VGH71_03330 [Gammaproteobacteria bacterium]